GHAYILPDKTAGDRGEVGDGPAGFVVEIVEDGAVQGIREDLQALLGRDRRLGIAGRHAWKYSRDGDRGVVRGDCGYVAVYVAQHETREVHDGKVANRSIEVHRPDRWSDRRHMLDEKCRMREVEFDIERVALVRGNHQRFNKVHVHRDGKV